MGKLFLFFIVLDSWRILLGAGFSIILLVSGWRKGVSGTSPVYQTIGSMLAPLALRLSLWLFGITGIFGMLYPRISPSHMGMSSVMFEWFGFLEGAVFLLGIFCVWKVCRIWEGQEAASRIWTGGACTLFFLAAFLWTLRWDLFVHGAGLRFESLGAIMIGWEWTRILPKYIHLGLSGLAAGGLVVVGIGLCRRGGFQPGNTVTSEEEEALTMRIIRFGLGWALGGVVPQVVVGSWVLVVSLDSVRDYFLSGIHFGSVLFFTNLLSALLGLVFMNASFIAPQVKGLVWGGWISIFFALVLMGFVRYESMRMALESLAGPVRLEPVDNPDVALCLFLMSGAAFFILKRWLGPSGTRRSLRFS